MKKMVLTERCIEEYVIRLRELERSENTVSKYRRDVMKLKNYAGEQRLDKNLVISFKEMLAEKYEVESLKTDNVTKAVWDQKLSEYKTAKQQMTEETQK